VTDQFNCDCEAISNYQTLAEIRVRMMRRLGYSAMAANPPPGMTELIDDFIRDSQTELWRKNPSLRSERFFRWTMTIGQRYYGIKDNDTSTEFTDTDCLKRLDQYHISWAGIEDTNGSWIPMSKGIDPTFYTTVLLNGFPTYYDVRSCIEVFPAPAFEYKLWIKGMFDLEPLIAPTDRTTLDDTLVFLLALGRAKSHYGQRDAQAVLNEAGDYLLDYKAGKHMTARYIPGQVKLPPAIQPFLTRYIPNP
jgi:hypothetical protein